jgi:hypothetical protein
MCLNELEVVSLPLLFVLFLVKANNSMRNAMINLTHNLNTFLTNGPCLEYSTNRDLEKMEHFFLYK